MIYIFHKGELVPRSAAEREDEHTPVARSDFPSPRVSRFEPMESPVTGKTISSWGERERDMNAVDAVDARDYPKGHEFKRGRKTQAKEMKDARRTATQRR
jgi:hypothetical protein